MRRLLAADRVRFGRRRDLQLLVALVPVILAVMFVADFNSVTAAPPDGQIFVDPPDPVIEAELRAQMLAEWRQRVAAALPGFAFPASLLKIAGNVGPVVLLAIYLATALVAGEFEWGTVRTIHLTASRGRTLAVRIGVVGGLIGLVLAIGLLLGAILPFALSFEGVPLQQLGGPVAGLWTGLADRLLVVLPFIAIPVLMAILARSIGVAFLLTLLFFVADVAVTSAPVWATSPVPWLPAVTITGAISRLVGEAAATLAPSVPVSVSFGALLGWGVVPVLAAIVRFRRVDLHE